MREALALLLLLLAGVALEAVLVPGGIPGKYAALGVVGATLITAVARGVGARWLQRPEPDHE